MDIKTANKKLIRDINKSIILRLIREKGPISRADIAKISGLNPATVSSNVNLLLENKIVIERGSGESSGGRKPILLELNINTFNVIGVDMGMKKVIAAAIDIEGRIIKKLVLLFDDVKCREDVLNVIKKAVYTIIGESGVNHDSFIGIGMGVHGLVDADRGISIYAPAFNWRNVNIKQIMEDEFGIPVFIDNDARVMALGEKWFGAAKNIDNFVFINVGSGIGSGIMINGELYRGTTFGAGEIGHINIVENGPKCNCGNYGCLEVLASGPALVKRVISRIKIGNTTLITKLVKDDLSKITGETIYEAAMMGDMIARDVLNEAGNYIGLATANIINMLNPKTIIIGGGVALSGDYVFKSLIKVAKEKSMKDSAENVEIQPAALKENCGVIGAATLVLKDLFQGPKIQ